MPPKGLPATTSKAPRCPVGRPPVPNAAPAASKPMSEYTAPSVAYPRRASRSIHGCALWAASLAWCLASSVRSPLELTFSSRAGTNGVSPNRTVYQFGSKHHPTVGARLGAAFLVGCECLKERRADERTRTTFLLITVALSCFHRCFQMFQKSLT